MVHETEVHAYAFILHELVERKGWKKDQIFTQNEIRKIKLIAEQLGDTAPENIVKISENTYFSAYSEIYGNNNIDKRICESISLLESIQFLE